jgi:hypothetical protein
VNAFHVLGGLLAVWAVLVAALGIVRHDFPRGRGAERLVAAISVLLVVGAIGSAVITAANEEHGEAGPESVEPQP